jgi:hypothetical protein
MRPYLITAKLMRPSNMKRFPTAVLDCPWCLLLSVPVCTVIEANLCSWRPLEELALHADQKDWDEQKVSQSAQPKLWTVLGSFAVSVLLLAKYSASDHSEDQGVDGRMRSEWILGRLAGGWVGFSWLGIVTGGELLWMRFLLHRGV